MPPSAVAWLGQRVRWVVLSANELGLDDVVCYELTDEEVAPCDVLGSVVVHYWITRDIDRGRVVLSMYIYIYIYI